MIRAVLLLWLAQNPVLRLPSEAPPLEEAAPSNLDFETGEAGAVPPDWSLTQASRVAGYRVELRREGCRSGSGCAVISSSPNRERGMAAGLIQQFPAIRYRGQRMRLRAWVKLQGQQRGDGLRVAFSTDGQGGDATFIQKGGRIIASEWTLAEVEGKVPWRAELIHLVVSVEGKGSFWIDDVSFEAVVKE
jgi:hypothetical protein